MMSLMDVLLRRGKQRLGVARPGNPGRAQASLAKAWSCQPRRHSLGHAVLPRHVTRFPMAWDVWKERKTNVTITLRDRNRSSVRQLD